MGNIVLICQKKEINFAMMINGSEQCARKDKILGAEFKLFGARKQL